MAEQSFKKGDVVILKSGGPRMTVTNVGPTFGTNQTMVWCIWFDGSKKYDDTFEPEVLELA